MKKIIILIFPLLLLACADVIVPDISEEEVELLAPVDGAVLIAQSVLFSWEYLPDATEYEIEIVSPSFDSVLYWVVDSFTTQRVLELQLTPRQYEWRVRAYNEAYSSACCQNKWSLVLNSDSSLDLTMLSLTLSQPFDESFINNNIINFSWNQMTTATAYSFELSEEPDFSAPISNQTLADNFVSISLENDGIYYWRVRAENNLSNTFTNWENRLFTLDQIPPEAPVLLSPINGDTLYPDNQNPDLIWSSSIESIGDSLYIYNDSNQTELMLQKWLLDSEFEIDTTLITLLAGNYYWKTRSFDSAGNLSNFSETRIFIIE